VTNWVAKRWVLRIRSELQTVCNFKPTTEAGPSIDGGRVVHVLWRTIILPLDVSRELFMDEQFLTPYGIWIISRTVAMIYLRKGGSTNQSSFLISFHKYDCSVLFF